jgi:hypothetical protein
LIHRQGIARHFVIIAQPMKLHGTLESNLKDALASARRHRGQTVYPDTIAFWRDLLREACRAQAERSGARSSQIGSLIVELQAELEDRS